MVRTLEKLCQNSLLQNLFVSLSQNGLIEVSHILHTTRECQYYQFYLAVLGEIKYTTLKYSPLVSTVMEGKEGNYKYREHKVDNIVCS